MAQDIQSEIQSLSPSAILEFFILNLTTSGSPVYFHAGTNGITKNIVWQGQTYMPMPIEAGGFNLVTRGSLPRPFIRVANAGGFFSAIVAANNDLIGCKVVRKRTFSKYIDAINFPGNANPYADPTQALRDDVWYVDRKSSEDKYMIEWELASPFDLFGVQLPFRNVIQNSCTWAYLSAECNMHPATQKYFDANDVACGAADDACGKRLTSCLIRAIPAISSPNFSGFPGATQYGN